MVLSAIVNKKNLVPQKQREYQASHRPIWYRPARSRLYVGVYSTTFALGVVGIAYSAFSLIKGKPT